MAEGSEYLQKKEKKYLINSTRDFKVFCCFFWLFNKKIYIKFDQECQKLARSIETIFAFFMSALPDGIEFKNNWFLGFFFYFEVFFTIQTKF